MKRFTAVLALLLCAGISAFAQEVDSKLVEKAKMNFQGSAQQAMSNSEYMVTAGDVYSLNFAANGTPVSYTIPVDTTYKIRVANLAVLDVSGSSFLSLKQQVEDIIQKNYPFSGVQFVLMTPGTFKVTVKGEVIETSEPSVWALTRLSSVVDGVTTDYSSIRDITVTSAKGKKHTYDLFQAIRFGDMSQNPYLRPGDVVTINRIKRVVTIEGAVERPGTYELMKGENLKTLVTYYASGLTDYADTSRIILERNVKSSAKGGDKIYLTQKNLDADYTLNNGDIIFISDKTETVSSIILEGVINKPGTLEEAEINPAAVTATASQNKSATADTMFRTAISFKSGENYASLIRRIQGNFNSYSDLLNSYIERDGKIIPINIEQILYDAEYVSPYEAKGNDKLVIPFQQHFQKILVKGEVKLVEEVDAWPLRRLSEIIEDKVTDYSSSRNVVITSVDGKETVCDIFKAKRFGDMSQDPYVRAGETVTVKRLERKVTIDGSVERPGLYELMKGENLKTLVTYYASGLTDYADTSRIILERNVKSSAKGGDKIYLTQKNLDADYTLNNGDIIFISDKTETVSSIILEGVINKPGTVEEAEINPAAMAAGGNQNKSATSETMYRTAVAFKSGENYATLIRRIQGNFNSYSDLLNSYIERDGKVIPINIEQILYDADYVSPYEAKGNDKLVIPFQQHFQKILVKGEVKLVEEVDAWPLRRLSEIIEDKVTDYSSSRNVVITSVDGKETVCDIFKAKRFGDMSQDPYVRAGESVTVKRLERKVTIDGSVERPGTYELLDGENLNELIYYYANGATELADFTRIELTRVLDKTKKTGNKIYLNESNVEGNYQLINYDSINIPNYRALRPVMFMEGAIQATEGTALESSERRIVQFDVDTEYNTLIQKYSAWFSSGSSDLERAYIIRGTQIIPMDLTKILYDASYYSKETVQPGDILRVPFKQLFVTVSGAVYAPGRYPYIPDRTAEYYVGLAGGFIKEKNSGNAMEIRDINGNKLSKTDYITPESMITAEANSAMYKFNQYSGVVTTAFSIISTALSTYAVIKSLTN